MTVSVPANLALPRFNMSAAAPPNANRQFIGASGYRLVSTYLPDRPTQRQTTDQSRSVATPILGLHNIKAKTK